MNRMSTQRLHSLMAPTNNKKNEIIHLLKSMTSVVCPLSFPDSVVSFGHMTSIATNQAEWLWGRKCSLSILVPDPFVSFDHVVSFVIN